jgi:hypothetical protein
MNATERAVSKPLQSRNKDEMTHAQYKKRMSLSLRRRVELKLPSVCCRFLNACTTARLLTRSKLWSPRIRKQHSAVYVMAMWAWSEGKEEGEWPTVWNRTTATQQNMQRKNNERICF